MRIQVANFLAILIDVYSTLILLYTISRYMELLYSSILRFQLVRWLFHFLRDVSEPFLGLLRQNIPGLKEMYFTPIAAVLILHFGGKFLVWTIAGA